MTDKDILSLAIDEIQTTRWGVTEQFFEIHNLVYEDNIPKVAGMSKDSEAGTAIVYFSVQNEKFYFAVCIDTNSGSKVKWVGTEADHSVYFSANSNDLSLDQLCRLTKLTPTDGWDKGDKRKGRGTPCNFSSVRFLPSPEPGTFEYKLNRLLDFLELDPEGVKKLAVGADCRIQVASIFHNGNTMLGGLHLNKEQVFRIGELGVAIDFDLYAEGKFFK